MGSTDLQFDKIRLKKKSTVTLSLEFIVDYFWDYLPTRNKFFKKYESIPLLCQRNIATKFHDD